MLKKRHIVIVSGIVSILLVSLFCANLVLGGDITPSGKPQPTICKDSVNISVLRIGRVGDSMPAVYITSQGGIYNIPFAFNPAETFLSVTNLWFSYIYGTSAPNTVNIYVNDILATAHYYDNANSIPYYTSFQVTDTNIHEALNSGINVLSLGVTNTFYLQEFTVFIEYEHQTG